MRFRPLARLSVVTALWCLVLAFTGSSSTAAPKVLAPPGTLVGGYSLFDAVQVTTPYNFAPGGCPEEGEGPTLPFVNLCVDRTAVPDGPGVLFTGEASYTVDEGTYLFHNIADVTDGEPVLGTFPRTAAKVPSYWYSTSRLGADRGTVTVDGQTATTGRHHLVGPVPLAEPLPVDDARNVTTQAVWIAPLPVGTHVIQTTTTLSGRLIAEVYGIAFIRIMDTITVTVVP